VDEEGLMALGAGVSVRIIKGARKGEEDVINEELDGAFILLGDGRPYSRAQLQEILPKD
jgi:hypothetical protein